MKRCFSRARAPRGPRRSKTRGVLRLPREVRACAPS
jgi:hypothetical protein